MRIRLLVLILPLALVATACRHRDEEPHERDVPIRVSRRVDPATTLREGDIRIASVDSSVDLALIADTISAGLSQKTLEKVRRETDTNSVKGSGFGAEIERMVKGTVQSAIATRVVFPLTDVRDVRYDGRKLIFDWNGKVHHNFGKANIDGKDFMESFSSGDAQRFVIAVRARKRAMGRT